ncbi:peptidoglycan-recognition protein SC2-like [Dreissena polymorpha]|uniref:Peptidoglycan-recognition protein n=1 Tax=Dreissena polymorpha TaxID=45954 RepID=A0A9D4CSJ6_DREPO|nr:peptidoglycan-recognition protein SC2-like [Dreissena polymorpha]KAH3730894.1 hypothetical protein DPMN_056893 [Dreissena polymorpha]
MIFLLCFSVALVIHVTGDTSCPEVTIVSRADWGARAPSSPSPALRGQTRVIFIHHTETSSCTDTATCSARVREIQSAQMEIRHWNDIGYNFLIGNDGNAYEGRGWGVAGDHTSGGGSREFGIAMIGNYESNLPSEAALNALDNILKCAVRKGHLSRRYCLMSHRDTDSRTCPGTAMHNEIISWPRYCWRW